MHRNNWKQASEHNPYIFNGKTIGNLTFSLEFSIFSRFSKVNVQGFYGVRALVIITNHFFKTKIAQPVKLGNQNMNVFCKKCLKEAEKKNDVV